MNKSKTLIWWDDEVYNSYLLCLEPYGIKLLRENQTDNCYETEITVYGPVENINRFIEDVEDDSLEPFEQISLEFEDCEEFYNELRDRVDRLIELQQFELDKYKSEPDSYVLSIDWEKTW